MPTQRQIAAGVGCSREMVSKLMKDLERGGYVEAGRRRVRLLKRLPQKW